MAKKKAVVKRKNLDPVEYPHWLNHEVWQEFIQFRTEIGKPIFEIGEKRMIKKLEVLSFNCDYREILDRSIRNNWQDIYPHKPDEKVEATATQTFDQSKHLQ